MLTGYSAGYSAILGLASCICISFKLKETRIDPSLAIIMAVMLVGSILTIVIKKFGVMEVIDPKTVKHLSAYLSYSNLIIIGLISFIIVYWFRTDSRDEVITQLSRFVGSCRQGTEASLKIGATVGVIGIIIGVLTFSGLVLTFADIVIELAGGSLVMTIFLIALASLVLGMGVPVTAAYLITAVVAVPALTHLGVNEIAAHMIVYWLSQDSNITPPVCIAAFAGATIAKANMWRTAFSSFKFAKFLYLGPFLFGYVPEFSLNGSPMDIAKVFVLIIFGTWLYSYLLSGIWIQSLMKIFGKKKILANEI